MRAGIHAHVRLPRHVESVRFVSCEAHHCYRAAAARMEFEGFRSCVELLPDWPVLPWEPVLVPIATWLCW